MPFRSKAQMRYLFANDPELAKKWARLYGVPKDMPDHVKPKRKPKRKPVKQHGSRH